KFDVPGQNDRPSFPRHHSSRPLPLRRLVLHRRPLLAFVHTTLRPIRRVVSLLPQLDPLLFHPPTRPPRRLHDLLDAQDPHAPVLLPKKAQPLRVLRLPPC
ncbi:unnamed protein product, partial [Tenebrio molitor]